MSHYKGLRNPATLKALYKANLAFFMSISEMDKTKIRPVKKRLNWPQTQYWSIFPDYEEL